MSRLPAITYGAASYLVFLAAFLYAIGFVGNFAVARSIDHGVAAPIGEAIVVNLLLLGAFAVAAQRDGASRVQTLVDTIRAQGR